MNVKLIAHTQLAESFDVETYGATDGAAVALTAIRTCYSVNKPSDIVASEGTKYFGEDATDGGSGTEADRLIRHIVRSKHVSTLEHVTFTFAVEDVSRSLLAQLTRHRVGFSFSVQSQRYVKFGSDDKSGGFGYVVPLSVRKAAEKQWGSVPPTEDIAHTYDVGDAYLNVMIYAQQIYDELREAGVPAEDARYVLPNATTTNLVMTVNLRSLLDFYEKRRAGNGAQWEIAELAELLRQSVVTVEPWTDAFFGGDRQ